MPAYVNPVKQNAIYGFGTHTNLIRRRAKARSFVFFFLVRYSYNDLL